MTAVGDGRGRLAGGDARGRPAAGDGRRRPAGGGARGAPAASLPLEHRILAIVASPRAPAEREARQALAALLDEVDDSGRLVRDAIDERMECLLYRRLQRAGLLDRIGETWRAELEDRYRGTAVLNLRHVAAVAELLERLEGAGVPVVVLKGLVLLEEVYRDVGLRPMTDADIWVRPRDRSAVVEALTDAGWQPEPLYPDTFRRPPTTLDLHARLLGERVASRSSLLAGGEEPVFRRARRIELGGRGALALDPHDEVVYLALHLLKHNAGRLIWLVDLNERVVECRKEGRTRLVDRARELGQERTLLRAAYLARGWLGGRAAPLFQELGREEALGRAERHALDRRLRGLPLPTWAPLLLFSARRGVAGTARYVLETLFPRPEILRQTLRDSEDLSVWQLYFRRFWTLLGRAARRHPG